MIELKGIFTALVTPFADGKVDEHAFQQLVEWQISKGIHGLVPCGTTGESATLSHEEHVHVIKLCVDAVAKQVPVIAGAGANSTEEAISLTRGAKDAGADAVLSVVPYYNKPSQEGLYQHFKEIHDAVDIPIILYNIPGRSGVALTNETIARLALLPNIIGLKDATADLARISPLRTQLIGQEFIQLSGEDMTAVAFNSLGGQGCISVTANVAPGRCARIQQACLDGNYEEALRIHDTIVPLHEAMFCEASPGPVKYALSLMNKCKVDLRLPMVPPSQPAQQQIRDALLGAGIL